MIGNLLYWLNPANFLRKAVKFADFVANFLMLMQVVNDGPKSTTGLKQPCCVMQIYFATAGAGAVSAAGWLA